MITLIIILMIIITMCIHIYIYIYIYILERYIRPSAVSEAEESRSLPTSVRGSVGLETPL